MQTYPKASSCLSLNSIQCLDLSFLLYFLWCVNTSAANAFSCKFTCLFHCSKSLYTFSWELRLRASIALHHQPVTLVTPLRGTKSWSTCGPVILTWTMYNANYQLLRVLVLTIFPCIAKLRVISNEVLVQARRVFSDVICCCAFFFTEMMFCIP